METKQPPATPQTPIVAMRALINSLPEGHQRAQGVEACVMLCFRLWGWNVERFRDEMAKG